MTRTEADELELHLYPELWDESIRLRWRESVLASVLAHVVLILALVIQAQFFPTPRQAARKSVPRVTLLFAPPAELTQKEPNRAPPSKLFMGAPQPARPPLKIVPRALPSTPPPPQPKGEQAREEKPPQLAPRPDPAGTAQLAQVLPPVKPVEPPKIVLEDAHKPAGGRRGDLQVGELNPQRPGGVIEGAVRDMARNPGAGGIVVGDGVGGGVPGGFTLPSRGSIGSNIELLSDPLGVDFKPYLTQILAAVRRNWYAVIPESARLGISRGRVAIQFIIIRSGGVSKLVIAGPSGQESLDRAAVAGISASNPFPPLPSEFRGDHVRLQFTFLYNIPVK